MLSRILQTRWIILIIVLFTILNAVAFMVIGIYSSVEGYIGIIKGHVHTDVHPGLYILEALDIFLVALVFLIFAMGIATLFLPDQSEETKSKIPSWLVINNFSELKLLLWEAVLTTLIVYFVSDIVRKEGNYSWEILMLPASILILSLCVYIIRKH